MKIRMRQMVVGAALMGAAAAGSALAASALTPGATDTSTTTVADNSSATPTTEVIDLAGSTGSQSTPAAGQQDQGPRGNFDPSKGGHQFNGITEQLLTGSTATKVQAAAEAAVSGGTVERVENDAEANAPYEAHVVKADGSHVTVYVNADFTVKSVETDAGHGGPGGHGRGGHGPQDQAPAQGTAPGSANSTGTTGASA
jgi:hypothetical protein